MTGNDESQAAQWRASGHSIIYTGTKHSQIKSDDHGKHSPYAIHDRALASAQGRAAADGRRVKCRGFDKKNQMGVNGRMFDWNRIKRNDVAVTLLKALHANGGEQQGFELMDGCDVPYTQAKSVLQSLRTDGLVVVVKDGPPGKKSWIAYQRLALTDEVFKHIDGMEAEVDKTLEQAKALVDGLNGKRRLIGVGWLDNPEKRGVLRMAVAAGLVRVTVEAVGQ